MDPTSADPFVIFCTYLTDALKIWSRPRTVSTRILSARDNLSWWQWQFSGTYHRHVAE